MHWRRSPGRSESLSASETLAGALRGILRERQAEHRLPSVSACVFRAGEILWAETVGLADVEARREAVPDTQYRIGSITKTFTAASIMQLRDAGALDLDDRLGDHLPEGPHSSATLRRLLAHLSGLQREPPGEIWETLELPSREELLAGLADARQVLKPGERWHYSNLAFVLLGEVVASRSGGSWEEYVRTRLLEPIGLARTTFGPEAPFAEGYFVEPYSETVLRERRLDLRGVAPAGQLWSTTEDLARWGSFLADPDPAVLATATAEEMHALQVMADPERWELGWGLGLMLYRRGARLYAGHDGGMPGHLAGLVFRRLDRVGAVALTNSGSNTDPTALALDLAEKTLELEPPAVGAWRPQEGPPAGLQDVLGRWWSEGAEFVFRFRSGRLEAALAHDPRRRPPAVFEPVGADVYRTVSGREHGEELRVVRHPSGEVSKLLWATYSFTRRPGIFGAG